MALTATATITLQYRVVRSIGMRDPHIIAIIPCIKNMMYSVNKFEAVATTFKPVVGRLQAEGTRMPRMMIILCGKSFGIFADIYLFFKAELGDNITEPTHVPGWFRMVDVFTSVTTKME